MVEVGGHTTNSEVGVGGGVSFVLLSVASTMTCCAETGCAHRGMFFRVLISIFGIRPCSGGVNLENWTTF